MRRLQDFIISLWGNFKCWADWHHPIELDEHTDPFRQLDGHADYCTWCGKYRRVIGNVDTETFHVLPWTSWDPRRTD